MARHFARLSGTIYFSGGFFVARSQPFQGCSIWCYLRYRHNWSNCTSPFFDNRYYYEASQDVREAGLEPVSHYLEHGWSELRSPSRYFDAEGFSETHSHLNGLRLDLAEVCLRLYGSYAWKVDDKIVPAAYAGGSDAAKTFTSRERRRLFKNWQKYRSFFDADFYLKEYQEAASTSDEAFMHYMHRGFSEDRQPRRDFDGYRYRKKNGLSRGQNPFRHCVDKLRDGEGFPSNVEDRLDQQVPSLEHFRQKGEVASHLKTTEARLSLCIHLHCFYIELLHEVVDRLRPLTMPFSFVVTVCSDADAVTARRLLGDLKGHEDFHVLVAANRGRDIAPFLIDARPIWRKSDLVLHLHTKRSPHISWGNNWRRYLIDRTIGGEPLLEGVINYFQHHAHTGIMYPENYCMIRHFTEKEQNSDSIRSVAQTLGLRGDFQALREYPAGSMAFYRVSALAGIFDADGLENLFEAENGQLDGTTAHALERLLAEAVRQGGYVATSY
ncbi:rhamnan synthesis F family protein [Ensifer sp. 4252]|uniref:rhamnan synthesis F family protein n=1 Tax=Ensifer sp. 4252 TaxID=3373915 RepID=UPI003D199EFC